MSIYVLVTVYLRLLNHHNSHHNVWSSKSHFEVFFPEGMHFQLNCAFKMFECINVAYHSPQHKIASSSPQITSSVSLLPSA